MCIRIYPLDLPTPRWPPLLCPRPTESPGKVVSAFNPEEYRIPIPAFAAMSSTIQILLIGVGELGTAFLPHLSGLPNTRVTIGVRTPSKYQHLSLPNLSLTALDLTSPSEILSETFAKYDIVISATGFGQSPGAVTKLTHDVLAAGLLRRQTGEGKLWFFPWQWGVDYDITGDGRGLMPLFGEQASVRNLLRSEAAKNNVKWTILSTGIFMSFLFEQFWAIVDSEFCQLPQQQDTSLHIRRRTDIEKQPRRTELW